MHLESELIKSFKLFLIYSSKNKICYAQFSRIAVERHFWTSGTEVHCVLNLFSKQRSVIPGLKI